jgi:hypothetical protein
MKIIFRGKVKNNKLIVGSDYEKYLSTLEGKDIDITVCEHKDTRSINQCRYYFAVVVKMISDETGYSKDETHEIIKGKFLSREKKVGKDIIHYTISTSKLKTNEFESLMTEIREWASIELNLMIPQPNEIDF